MSDIKPKRHNPEDSSNKSIYLDNIAIFNAGNDFKYLFKRTEKIVHALYIVTNHIKDIEPIKVEIRDRAISLLTISLEMNAEISDHMNLLNSFLIALSEVLPFIELLSVSSYISSTNAKIITEEIGKFAFFVKDKISSDSIKKGLILSTDFFGVGMEMKEAESGKKKSKNKHNISDISQDNSREISSSIVGSSTMHEKKNNRQEVIVNLLKDRSNLTIKDFVSVITDCSEKTIQRELTELVIKGIIRKDGDRRWSTYSLI